MAPSPSPSPSAPPASSMAWTNRTRSVVHCHSSSSTLTRVITTAVCLSLFLLTPNWAPSPVAAQKVLDTLSCDFNDDSLCEWSFTTGRQDNAHFEGIFNVTNYDYDSEQDQILLIRPSADQPKDLITWALKSPEFFSGDYEVSFNVNMNFAGNVYIVVDQSESRAASQILKISGNRSKKWDTYSIKLPKYIKISVVLEIKFDEEALNIREDYIAINNLNIVDKKSAIESCEYKCASEGKCLPADAICNTIRDCPLGDDESRNCDKLPPGSYCTFGENFCGWFALDGANASGQWIHVATGPGEGYLGVAHQGAHRFGSLAFLYSGTFPPIPLYHSMVSSKYYKTCRARFSYLFSATSSDLSLELEPQSADHREAASSGGEKRVKSVQVWRHFSRHKSLKWENVSVSLPLSYHTGYRLKFGAALGLKSFNPSSQRISVAIDNFSLSKECFALDVPVTEPRIPPFIPSLIRGAPFIIPANRTLRRFTFTSCGAVGRIGPTYSQCESFYLNTSTRAAVFENENLSLNGSQMWTVPRSAFYTIFARGADGGRGLYNQTGGRGSLVRASFWFQEGDTIFISVGQPGASACSEGTSHLGACNSGQDAEEPRKPPAAKSRLEVGGAGGGATYVFKVTPNQSQKWIPLLIAGGGGGGGGKLNGDLKYTQTKNGRGFDFYNPGTAGNGEGSGGGWNYTAHTYTPPTASNQTGKSLLFGAEGGLPCRRFTKWSTEGGFGGGGGGCNYGGGGGGFTGGNTNKISESGDGGTSYVDFRRSHLQLYSDFDDLEAHSSAASNSPGGGGGLVVILPQVDACCNGGSYACLVTGESLNGSLMKQCICGHDRFMAELCIYERPLYLTMLWIALCGLLLLFLLFISTYFYISKRSLAAKAALSRNESTDLRLLSCSSSTDVQLSRLRSHNHAAELHYNPNYEFGGSTCTMQDLRDVARDKLNLVKALGQGAFGEVYQGYLHNMPGEVTDQLPVAVKTLPEYSANKQAEMDFLMEALIMSKFKHRNIVRFIGVCFEKMPHFIVLELLPGGDLKSFLREHRNTVEARSNLLMGDLLTMALDVASGCKYLEENHFIHRDIAARNCLLTAKTKRPSSITAVSSAPPDGPFDLANYQNGFNNSGIVVKIADFGMAREIYRADYYRKGGKAMLPVKWMPPEAFLDGVFTSKTDVWSFGVLLWEVLSMGYMPYPGRGNQEVMQLVTQGGRLDPPNSSTPSLVYALMNHCWQTTPDLRPSFGEIIDRLGQCLLDEDVLSCTLPVFQRTASMEKDMTLMRPPPDAKGYLVANNLGSQTTSNYSMATEKTELLSPDSYSTLSCVPDEKLLELEARNANVNLWNDDVLAHQILNAQQAGAQVPGAPFSVNINPLNSYAQRALPETGFNPTGILLNPGSLSAYPTAGQGPASVRYVNVNVNRGDMVAPYHQAPMVPNVASPAQQQSLNDTATSSAPVLNC